ncbi:DUF6316 family protein [Methylobacter sp.]|uniref:DUF6316 family protein n=1 Tax=Methylobacter sp. TaxID=2051955 RepID=UPI00120660F3|nr:DUF6316 family protein [Methylobacter sp.]TAK62249.1 MAG: hypothetical protein EPO18_11210 [Methylobacter sp.]
MFKSARTFCQRNAETGLMEWFFHAREGIYGPFFDKEKAVKALEKFIKQNIETFDDGGRSSNSQAKLSLEQPVISVTTIKFDNLKSKRGKDS